MRGVRILNALLAGPQTRRQLEIALGVCDTAVTKALRCLRTRSNVLVRVCGHEEHPDGQRGKPSPIYTLSDGRPDVDPIPAVGHEERNRAYRVRNRQRWLALKREANKRATKRRVASRAALWSELIR